jgi:ABC-type transport system involved in multi-copper enzyme maturation permease subunit
MTAQSVIEETAGSGTAPQRTRVGFLDLAWLTWRQHRWTVLSLAVAVGAFLGYVLWTNSQLAATSGVQQGCGPDCTGSQFFGIFYGPRQLADYQMYFSTVAAGVIGVFLGAPMVSREYEQRTNLLVFGQDVTPLRWLASKASLLGVVAVGLGFAVGMVGATLADTLHSLDYGYNLFEGVGFEMSPLVQAGYALFAFAVGLVWSVVTRRTSVAMGGTVAVFAVTRVVVAMIRPYYETPVRSTLSGVFTGPSVDALHVDSGYLDLAGNPAAHGISCAGPLAQSDQFDNCMRANGMSAYYVDYQPIGRLDTFRLIEFAIFAGLAVVLFTVTWFRMRRRIG